MATSRTAFIPWNESQAGNFKAEYEECHQNRSQSHHKRKWNIVYLDTPGKPLAKIGFGVGTRLMIAGHGAIGDPTIAADHGTGGADRSYVEVVDMLFEKGLRKYYLGTVACDICYSALGSPPFAKLLARELFQRGVKASCVLGYKGPLGAVYNTELTGSKYTHRVVDVEDSSGNVLETVKSSSMQERFFGWT
jgi:hypothetical protein